MDLKASLTIAASGMRAQGVRLRTIAENLANASSTAPTGGGEPYRRKLVSFTQELDRATGAEVVKVARVTGDTKPFEKRHDPGNPSAGPDGYVLLPNVNPLIEAMDMREAQRSYEANVSVIELAKGMMMRTIDILRG